MGTSSEVAEESEVNACHGTAGPEAGLRRDLDPGRRHEAEDDQAQVAGQYRLRLSHLAPPSSS
jgi:hypothetical protein